MMDEMIRRTVPPICTGLPRGLGRLWAVHSRRFCVRVSPSVDSPPPASITRRRNDVCRRSVLDEPLKQASFADSAPQCGYSLRRQSFGVFGTSPPHPTLVRGRRVPAVHSHSVLKARQPQCSHVQ